MKSGHVSRELWALDLNSLGWERVETTQGQCMESKNAKICGPINSMGHTANVLSNRMIIIFGHSPKYGYLDTVQECKLYCGVNHSSMLSARFLYSYSRASEASDPSGPSECHFCYSVFSRRAGTSYRHACLARCNEK